MSDVLIYAACSGCLYGVVASTLFFSLSSNFQGEDKWADATFLAAAVFWPFTLIISLVSWVLSLPFAHVRKFKANRKNMRDIREFYQWRDAQNAIHQETSE